MAKKRHTYLKYVTIYYVKSGKRGLFIRIRKASGGEGFIHVLDLDTCFPD